MESKFTPHATPPTLKWAWIRVLGLKRCTPMEDRGAVESSTEITCAYDTHSLPSHNLSNQCGPPLSMVSNPITIIYVALIAPPISYQSPTRVNSHFQKKGSGPTRAGDSCPFTIGKSCPPTVIFAGRRPADRNLTTPFLESGKI